MTRTEVTEYQTNVPASSTATGLAAMPNGEVDPFLAYGQANTFAEGQFLSFKNGEWLYGMNQEVLPIGTKVAVNMLGMRTGWRRWESRQVVDDRTSLLTDRQPPLPRSALGDNDQSLWEKLEGRPRDPWAMTMIVEMVDGSGEKYIYSTSSFGGRKCLNELCVSFGKERRLRPGQVPIVELGADTYDHKSYGRTWEPILKIVQWAHEGSLEVVEDTPPLPPSGPPAEEAKAAAHATAQAVRADVRAAQEDEPPFDVKPAPKAATQPAVKTGERRVPRF